MRKKMKSYKICCICKEEFEGYGNNAEPLMKGTCCGYCNILVVAERLKRFRTLNDIKKKEVKKS
jgi:hypothetical protein